MKADGQILASKARSQTPVAIRSLLGLVPKTARRVSDDAMIGALAMSLS